MAADQQWYVEVSGQVLGPITHDNLSGLASRGSIGRETRVSPDRIAWCRADEVSDLVFGISVPETCELHARDTQEATAAAQPSQLSNLSNPRGVKLLAASWVVLVSFATLLPSMVLSFVLVYALLAYPFIDLSGLDLLNSVGELNTSNINAVDTTRFRVLTDDNGLPLRGPSGGIMVVDKEKERRAMQESARGAREERRGTVLYWLSTVALQVAVLLLVRNHAHKFGRRSRVVVTALGGLSAGALVSGVIFGSAWLAGFAAVAAAWGAIVLHRRFEQTRAEHF